MPMAALFRADGRERSRRKASGDRGMARKDAKAKKGNVVTRFLRETRSELRKVVWPTRREALNMTGIVLAVTLVMAAGLGIIDWLFTRVFALVVR
jgi:preprotein translocase subunit SecE